MEEKMSVRQWQERFRAGTFDSSDTAVQCMAGWYDWFCRDNALAGRLKKLSKVVMGITDPFILDNFYIWFKNNCPMSGPLYDDVRFEPLVGERDGRYFLVTLDSPHERMKWALTTERFGFGAPEFECGDVREMIRYINRIGPELEQGITPSFVVEKRAVEIYARIHGEPSGIHVYREGPHRYSYTSFQDNQPRNVMAAASLEDAPSGFVPEHAESVKGIYVYCPEDVGKPLPDLVQPPAAIRFKRKEAER